MQKWILARGTELLHSTFNILHFTLCGVLKFYCAPINLKCKILNVKYRS